MRAYSQYSPANNIINRTRYTYNLRRFLEMSRRFWRASEKVLAVGGRRRGWTGGWNRRESERGVSKKQKLYVINYHWSEVYESRFYGLSMIQCLLWSWVRVALGSARRTDRGDGVRRTGYERRQSVWSAPAIGADVAEGGLWGCGVPFAGRPACSSDRWWGCIMTNSVISVLEKKYMQGVPLETTKNYGQSISVFFFFLRMPGQKTFILDLFGKYKYYNCMNGPGA